MEVEIFKQKANRLFQTADHLTYMVYPMVKDNKLLMGIVKDLDDANKCAMDIIINNERKQKRIKALPDNFHTKLVAFRQHCAARYGVSDDIIQSIAELRDIVEEHNKSTVEFSRKDRFLIFSEGYDKMNVIEFSKLKNHLNKTRKLMEVINKIK